LVVVAGGVLGGGGGYGAAAAVVPGLTPPVIGPAAAVPAPIAGSGWLWLLGLVLAAWHRRRRVINEEAVT
jgi:MYXO-CTERM domain-containing protein